MATLSISRRDCEEGTLPKVCLKCGQQATGFVEQDFFGTLLWTPRLSFLIWRRGGWESPRLGVPFGGPHRHYWRNRRLMISATSVAGVLFGVLFALAFGASWRRVGGLPAPHNDGFGG